MQLSCNGVPLWLMKEYLTELGAREMAENVLVANGWQAVVSKGEPVRIGSLVVGVTQVELSGDEDSIEAMLEKLHRKTMRCGA